MSERGKQVRKTKVHDVSVNRNPINGSVVVSAVVDGFVESIAYYGYNKREAMILFRRNIKKRDDIKAFGAAMNSHRTGASLARQDGTAEEGHDCANC
jgi:hypothetical protein